MNPYDESLREGGRYAAAPYENGGQSEGTETGNDVPYCIPCRLPGVPYITAYAIAVKHGFEGTEEEWIKSINNNVMVVKATDLYPGENDAGTFRTTTTLEEIAEASEKGKIVALDAYGSIAWLTQLVAGRQARFAGATYRAEEMDCYTEFVITVDGQTTYQTYVMRSGGYELPADGIPAEDLSEEVLELLRTQTAYGFASFEEYESYNTQNPDAIKPGDLIWIGNNSQKTMFQKEPTFLKPIVVIDAANGELGEDGGYYLIDATQVDDHTMRLQFTATKTNMQTIPDKDIHLPAGKAGSDGGYYTVTVSQTDASTMKLSFAPSKTGMPEIQPQTVSLPAGRDGDSVKGDQGDPGQAGMFWYTSVQPYTSSDGAIFVIGDLSGPAGAVPAPGSMIISRSTGLGYFITEVDEEVAVVAAHTVQIAAKITDADKTAMVNAVIAALPVYGGETQ